MKDLLQDAEGKLDIYSQTINNYASEIEEMKTKHRKQIAKEKDYTDEKLKDYKINKKLCQLLKNSNDEYKEENITLTQLNKKLFDNL